MKPGQAAESRVREASALKVFVSWSGKESHALALVLRKWLPVMFGGLNVFVSSEDIDKGARWANMLDDELARTDFGLVCLTPGNLTAPWLLFEAGALARAVDRSHCACILSGVEKASLGYPLAQFQATEINRDELLLLSQTINESLGGAGQDRSALEARFDAMWPLLSTGLDGLDRYPDGGMRRPARSDRELLEELVAAVRDLTSAVVFQDVDKGDRPASEVGAGDVPIVRARWRDTHGR